MFTLYLRYLLIWNQLVLEAGASLKEHKLHASFIPLVMSVADTTYTVVCTAVVSGIEMVYGMLTK